DGRVSKEAAMHYLGETYIAQEKPDEAVKILSKIIDNPNFALMTDRFGSRMNEEGDVFWDLFRAGNYKRSSGNLEAIWVMQEEHNVAGGEGNNLDMYYGFCGERFYNPAYWIILDPDGVNGFIGPTTQNGGRGAGEVKGTDHFYNTIWESDFDNDIRNSKYNIKRDFIYDNPNSAYFGLKVSENRPKNELPTFDYSFYRQLTNFIRVFNDAADIMQIPDKGILISSDRSSYLYQYYLMKSKTY